MDAIDARILELIQSGFPVVHRPFQQLGKQAGVEESEALARVRRLVEEGVIRRIGPVFDIQRLHYVSTLCGARVRPDALESVAHRINCFPEVTHNYERDHSFNLWFTLVAPGRSRVDTLIETIRKMDGVECVYEFPAGRVFKIRVHFTPQNNREDNTSE